MTSLSFDGLTAYYDRTRTFDAVCFGQAMNWLAERFPPLQFPAILEPGVGTGRIALPLVEHGYQVTGLDISEEMLGLCNAQSQGLWNKQCISLPASRRRLPAVEFNVV